MLLVWVSECRHKRFIRKEMDMPAVWDRTRQGYQRCEEYTYRRIKKTSIKRKTYIGLVQPELTPVEIVGYEVDEAGSPLALDNG